MADEKKKEAAAQPKSNEKSAKPEKAKKDTAAKKDSSKDGKASRGARARKSIAKFFKDFRSECKKNRMARQKDRAEKLVGRHCGGRHSCCHFMACGYRPCGRG